MISKRSTSLWLRAALVIVCFSVVLSPNAYSATAAPDTVCPPAANSYKYMSTYSSSSSGFDGVQIVDNEDTLTPYICGNGDHTLRTPELFLADNTVAESTGEDRGSRIDRREQR